MKEKNMKQKSLQVAYFSMEFAVDHRIPNYAGGLGVLAADYMLAMADMKYSGIGVSLVYHQNEDPKLGFDPNQYMKKLDVTTSIQIEGRTVVLALYKYTVKSGKRTIPLICLSTNVPENDPWDREITRYLYPSNPYHRLAQEAILGIGGVRALRALGYTQIDYFHMNEGHAALLTLELLQECGYDDDAVRAQSRFTTHTPVAAGHDAFDYELAHRMLGDMLPWHIKELATEQHLSMTHLALNLSGKSNSVSEKHRDVCVDMFPGYDFENVTNGIEHTRWAAPATEKILNDHIKQWKLHPHKLKQAKTLLQRDVKSMREANKKRFVDWINTKTDLFVFSSPAQKSDLFEEDVLTFGFARRFVPYKRANLIFRDIQRLRKLGYKKLQFVFAGPVHPDNHFGIDMVQQMREYADQLRGQIKVVVIPEYNTNISSYLISGVDVWLNNPILPREASGTSGMKAALNGVLNCSIPDGWWIEGIAKQPKAGWQFGGIERYSTEDERDNYDSEAFYTVLADVIDCYYNRKNEWLDRARHAMALGADFSAQRSIEEYDKKMWSK